MAECKEKPTVLNSQTILGLTFGQIMALIGIVFSFAMGYADLKADIAELRQKQAVYDELVTDQKKQVAKSDEAINDIKQSLIRIEGKLDLKQDRFK